MLEVRLAALPGEDLAAVRARFEAVVDARVEWRGFQADGFTLSREEPINEWDLKYVNRLSDTFFVLGRWVAKHMGEKEYLWERGLSAHRRPRKRA